MLPLLQQNAHDLAVCLGLHNISTWLRHDRNIDHCMPSAALQPVLLTCLGEKCIRLVVSAQDLLGSDLLHLPQLTRVSVCILVSTLASTLIPTLICIHIHLHVNTHSSSATYCTSITIVTADGLPLLEFGGGGGHIWPDGGGGCQAGEQSAI